MSKLEQAEFVLVIIIAAVFCFFTFHLLIKLKKQKKIYENKIQSLENEIRHDPMTGTLSRRGFIEAMEFQLADDPNGTLLIFDVNGFKMVNDTFGHMEGDLLIKRFSSRLQRAFDKQLVGRLGGDEFLVFVSGECNKGFINGRIKKAGIAEFPDKVTKLTLTSCCGAAIAPKNGTNFDDLYRMADKALYRSKASAHEIVYCK